MPNFQIFQVMERKKKTFNQQEALFKKVLQLCMKIFFVIKEGVL